MSGLAHLVTAAPPRTLDELWRWLGLAQAPTWRADLLQHLAAPVPGVRDVSVQLADTGHHGGYQRTTSIAHATILVDEPRALEAALAARYGAPLVVVSPARRFVAVALPGGPAAPPTFETPARCYRRYGDWLVRDADGALEWHQHAPTWAVAAVDEEQRAAWLAAYAADLARDGALARLPPPTPGVVVRLIKTPGEPRGEPRVELLPSPPIPALYVIRAFGWGETVWSSVGVHVADWRLAPRTGDTVAAEARHGRFTIATGIGHGPNGDPVAGLRTLGLACHVHQLDTVRYIHVSAR